MQLIRGKRHEIPLAKLNSCAIEECDAVWAAVAYVTDDGPLIKACHSKKIPLKLWARYDHGVPVNTSILRWFLSKAPLSVCKLVPDIHHAKVIWWRGYGVYIGSANMTKSAWGANLEAGVFLTENELDEQSMRQELAAFFEDIDAASHGLTREIVEEQERLQQNPLSNAQEQLRKEFGKTRIIPRCESMLQIKTSKTAKNEKLTRFLKEWNDTLEIIRSIGVHVSQSENRPVWISPEVPQGVQADQFLHAFYYQQVIIKGKATHHAMHAENAAHVSKVQERTIQWWAGLDAPPESEAVTIYELAPVVRKHLSHECIRDLSKDRFLKVMGCVHAFRDYANRTSYQALGLAEKLPEMAAIERCRLVASRLWDEVNQQGESVVDTLEYLLYGGDDGQLPHRLFEVAFDPSRKLRFTGISTYGEIVGWALPERFPPRNGRTSKALYALGYDVELYTE